MRPYVLLPAALVLFSCGLKPHPIYRSRPKSEYHRAPAVARTPAPPPAAAAPSDAQRCIQNTVDKYLGVPYRLGGTNRFGFDCSGFVGVVFGECRGLPLPRTAEEMYRTGTSVAHEELALGDLVFFSTGLRSIDHVGIFLGDGRFAHASSTGGVMISGLDEEYYRTRFRGAVRIR